MSKRKKGSEPSGATEEARSGMAAAQLLALASHDVEFQKRQTQREREEDIEFEKAVAEAKREQQRLLEEIRSRGYDVELLEELRERYGGSGYEDLVDLLVDELNTTESEGLVASLAGALNHRSARGLAAGALIEAFRRWSRTFDNDMCLTRDLLSGAIDTTSTKADGESLRNLLEDPKHRPHIALLIPSYGRSLGKEAVPVLLELLGDRRNSDMAIRTLGNLRAVEAEKCIEAFLHDDDAHVRREARKAMKKIESARRTGAFTPRVPRLLK